MWMGREFGFDMDKKTALSDSQYRKYEQIVKEIAFDMGVTPRQAQASIWFGIREGHSPMHKGDPGLDSVTYEQLLEKTIPNFTYIDKNGKEQPLTDLNKDTIVYLNGSFGLTPEMLDTIGKALVDTGRYVYDNLSPSMQKMGNRLGVNAQNFKLKFAQFKNDAKGMTDNAKKWFKKVVGQMKTWFKKNAQSLIDSKPVQDLYRRAENLVVKKFVSDDDITSMLRETMDKAAEKVKGKDKAEVKSEAEIIKKIRTESDPEKSDGVISAKAGMLGRGFHLISERLKNIDLKGGGGLAIARALRLTYEKYKLYVQQDMVKLQPVLDALRKVEKANIEDYRELT